MEKIPMFFVVNKNSRTRNPCTNATYDGQYVQRNGFQTSDVKYATPYWTKKGAVALINKLNKSGGQEAPRWARSPAFDANDGRCTPEYEIIEAVLVI